MGIVYRARDLTLDRVVAFKLIAPEFATEPDFRARFKRESRQAASIRHPNVISIYSAGEEGDLLFITMDYVEGTDLKNFVGIRGRLDPKLAADLVSQVASGLEAAHARGLVHRDVKPANVLIENQRHAYLTDFGLTKRAAAGSALTRTGLIVGTTDYLAPEQIQGDKLDARGDVYALGCVLYEALTGFVPYPRDTGAATMWAHMSEPPPSVLERAPDVPVEYDVVVSRAMAKDPNQRFTSAEALGRALQSAAADGGSRGGILIPETSESPAPAAGADTRPAAGQSMQGQQDVGRTRVRRAAPSDAMATPEADATPERPTRGLDHDQDHAAAESSSPVRGRRRRPCAGRRRCRAPVRRWR